MDASTFAEPDPIRAAAETLLKAARERGWTLDERECLRSAADAVLKARDVLRHHAHRPLIRRDRIAAEGPIAPDGPSVTVREAALALGISPDAVYRRAHTYCVGTKDAGDGGRPMLRLSPADLLTLQG